MRGKARKELVSLRVRVPEQQNERLRARQSMQRLDGLSNSLAGVFEITCREKHQGAVFRQAQHPTDEIFLEPAVLGQVDTVSDNQWLTLNNAGAGRCIGHPLGRRNAGNVRVGVHASLDVLQQSRENECIVDRPLFGRAAGAAGLELGAAHRIQAAPCEWRAVMDGPDNRKFCSKRA